MITIKNINFDDKNDYRLKRITGDEPIEYNGYLAHNYDLIPIQKETGLGNSYAKVYFTNKGFFILKDNKNIPDHVYKLEARLNSDLNDDLFDGDFLYSKKLNIPLNIYVKAIIGYDLIPNGEYQVMIQTLYISDEKITEYLCKELESLNIELEEVTSNFIHIKATEENLKLLEVEYLCSDEYDPIVAFHKHTESMKALANKIS